MGEHLQYNLKHKSERLGHKLMKRKWEKSSGSNKSKSPNGEDLIECNFESSEKKIEVHMP